MGCVCGLHWCWSHHSIIIMVSALHNTTVTFSKNVANGVMFVLEVSCQCQNSTVGFLQIPCCLIPEYKGLM